MSKKITYLNLKILYYLKMRTYHLSFQWVIIILQVEGRASTLMAADWSGRWLLKAEGNFLKQDNEVCISTDSSFHKQFLYSMWCCVIAFYSQQNFQNWSQSTQFFKTGAAA